MARLLLLTHEFAPFRGGIAAVADGLAAGAVAAGHSPIVVAPDYGARHDRADLDRPYLVRRFAGATCSILSMDKLVRFTAHCAAEIRHTRPDLVHAIDPPAQMALTMLARLRRLKTYVFTVHGTELVRYRHESFPRLWMGGGMRRVTSVHAVSHAAHTLLDTGARSAPRNAFVEPPGIRRVWLDQPVADRDVQRAGWRAARDDFVLLTLARRVPEKGHEDVLTAVGLLPDRLQRRIVYVIAGSGPDDYAQRLEAAAARAGVRLVLAGSIPDEEAIAACDGADLFVMLSRETRTRLEGFGIAYIEAAARGLPSLARQTGGVAEAVRDGETGLILRSSAGPDTIAPVVESLVLDAELRARLGANARAMAPDFAWEIRASAVYARFLAQI
jgi:phosphatidylinositol alpha-1,6-mannosyltransferase